MLRGRKRLIKASGHTQTPALVNRLQSVYRLPLQQWQLCRRGGWPTNTAFHQTRQEGGRGEGEEGGGGRGGGGVHNSQSCLTPSRREEGSAGGSGHQPTAMLGDIVWLCVMQLPTGLPSLETTDQGGYGMRGREGAGGRGKEGEGPGRQGGVDSDIKIISKTAVNSSSLTGAKEELSRGI